jgi:predicted DNA-binding protein
MYVMYKSINVNDTTFQHIDTLSTKLNKPKAQVVEAAVMELEKSMEEQEKAKLAQFNAEMEAKIHALKFSKDITVSTDNIDADFAALAETEYGK